LNVASAEGEIAPRRISFNSSTNSGGFHTIYQCVFEEKMAMRLTIILLTKYFFEIYSKLDAFLPCLAFKSKEWGAFSHWRELEEITCNNQLSHTRASGSEITAELA